MHSWKCSWNNIFSIMITRCSMRGTRETALLHAWVQIHAYSYIQQSGHSVKTMSAKNTKKSPILENADANITCHFGDGDISSFGSRLTHRSTHGHIVSSITVRCTLYSINLVTNAAQVSLQLRPYVTSAVLGVDCHTHGQTARRSHR